MVYRCCYCCRNLEAQAKWWAVLEVVWACIGLFIFSTGPSSVNDREKLGSISTEYAKTARTVLIILIVNYVIRLLFDLALAIGVWKKNIKYLWTWIGFAAVELTFLFIVVVIMALTITNNKKIGAILGVIASIIFLCGCIFVFHAFIKEIKQGGPRQVYSQVYYAAGASQPQKQHYYVAGASQPQPQVSTLRALPATTSDGAADVTQPRPNYISPL